MIYIKFIYACISLRNYLKASILKFEKPIAYKIIL